jgi:plasmid rolling circle replication initiator protein Rep
MLFELCNSLANFQNYINNIFWNALNKYATAYLNDVLIYSELRFNYRKYVRKIVKRFINAGLQINVNKCELNATKTKYLGLIIRPGGIEMNSEKIKAVPT